LPAAAKRAWKSWREHGAAEHADVSAPALSATLELARRHPAFRGRRLEVRDHAERVHAGICPAGTMDTGMARNNFASAGLDFPALPSAVFHLPAFVLGAVVRDGELNFRQTIWSSRD